VSTVTLAGLPLPEELPEELDGLEGGLMGLPEASMLKLVGGLLDEPELLPDELPDEPLLLLELLSELDGLELELPELELPELPVDESLVRSPRTDSAADAWAAASGLLDASLIKLCTEEIRSLVVALASKSSERISSSENAAKTFLMASVSTGASGVRVSTGLADGTTAALWSEPGFAWLVTVMTAGGMTWPVTALSPLD
jgi:hypothetical protein